MPTGTVRRGFNYIRDIFLGVDRFPEPIKLNFNKKDSIPSCIGSLMTIICYSVVAIYGF